MKSGWDDEWHFIVDLLLKCLWKMSLSHVIVFSLMMPKIGQWSCSICLSACVHIKWKACWDRICPLPAPSSTRQSSCTTEERSVARRLVSPTLLLVFPETIQYFWSSQPIHTNSAQTSPGDHEPFYETLVWKMGFDWICQKFYFPWLRGVHTGFQKMSRYKISNIHCNQCFSYKPLGASWQQSNLQARFCVSFLKVRKALRVISNVGQSLLENVLSVVRWCWLPSSRLSTLPNRMQKEA